MNNLLALLSIIGPLSVMVALIVLALLSQRLGSVTKRAPLYRYLFGSVALVGLSIIARMISFFVPDGHAPDLIADVLFALGLMLAVAIAWQYWSWLLSERGQDTRHTNL